MRLYIDDDATLAYLHGYEHAKSEAHTEIERLRAENAELERKLFVDRLSDAERIRQELCASMQEEDQRNRDENDRLRAENASLRFGLGFYADFEDDFGNHARAILAKTAKEGE